MGRPTSERADAGRVVITGVGLTSPVGNNLGELRHSLLEGISGVKDYNIRYVGDTFAGLCDFDPYRYQKKKEVRIGTRAGSISVYCAHEALLDSGLELGAGVDPSRVGVFLGLTEHGNVETEHEIYELGKYDYQTRYWSHYHNPRTVANNPAGEVTLNMGITGPHYTVGAACAAGNLGVVNAAQQIILGEVDVALAGGVSESPQSFGIFAAFASQNALAHGGEASRASRPFDLSRNGIVIGEGGAVFVLERLDRAKARGAKIYGEIAGYHSNSDATDFVLPNSARQAECMVGALASAGISPEDVDIVSTHATSTPAGDVKECEALRSVFGDSCVNTHYNNAKSFMGHCMGAAAALELAGNLPAFEDHAVHPTINIEELDPACALPNLVINEAREISRADVIVNNSFGMLGINCVLVVSRYRG